MENKKIRRYLSKMRKMLSDVFWVQDEDRFNLVAERFEEFEFYIEAEVEKLERENSAFKTYGTYQEK